MGVKWDFRDVPGFYGRVPKKTTRSHFLFTCPGKGNFYCPFIGNNRAEMHYEGIDKTIRTVTNVLSIVYMEESRGKLVSGGSCDLWRAEPKNYDMPPMSHSTDDK